MSRRVRSAVLACVLALGLSATLPVRAAWADRASAEAAMPADKAVPFLLVTKTTTTSGAWDDLPRLPEYAVYPDGQFLIQKSDRRLWGGVLPREQVLDVMDFLASDVQMASLSLTYYVSMPLTTFTPYTLHDPRGHERGATPRLGRLRHQREGRRGAARPRRPAHCGRSRTAPTGCTSRPASSS